MAYSILEKVFLWINLCLCGVGAILLSVGVFKTGARRREFFTMGFLTLWATVISIMSTLSHIGIFKHPTHNNEEVISPWYADHIFTDAIILFALGILSTAVKSVIGAVVGMGVLTIALEFVATNSTSTKRIIWWSIALFLHLVTFITLFATNPAQRPRSVTRLYRNLTAIMFFVWTVFRVMWALGSDAWNILSPTITIIVFVSLDTIVKVFFFMTIVTDRKALSDLPSPRRAGKEGRPLLDDNARRTHERAVAPGGPQGPASTVASRRPPGTELAGVPGRPDARGRMGAREGRLASGAGVGGSPPPDGFGGRSPPRGGGMGLSSSPPAGGRPLGRGDGSISPPGGLGRRPAAGVLTPPPGGDSMSLSPPPPRDVGSEPPPYGRPSSGGAGYGV